MCALLRILQLYRVTSTLYEPKDVTRWFDYVVNWIPIKMYDTTTRRATHTFPW